MRKRYIIITCSTILIVGLGLILAYLYNETRRRREYDRLRDSMVRRRIQKDIGMDNLEEALVSSQRVFRDSYGYNLLAELAADDREPAYSEQAVIRHDMELYFEKVIDMMRREAPSLSDTEISYCIYRYLGVDWRLAMGLVNRSSSYAGRLKQYIQKKIPAEWMRLFFQQ